MDRYAYLLEHLYCNDSRRLRAFAASGPGRFSRHLQRSRETMLRRCARGGGISQDDRRGLSAIGDGSMPDPESAAHAAEGAEAVRSALNALEPSDQLLLRLRFYHDLAAREIAEVMGFPTQFHVYRRLRSVLALLSKQLPRAYTGDIP
jgi:RNA polymerase sigma factor (sigma-70 family)